MRKKPNNVQWTDAQWEAIAATGSDILVAAAAGSGKTAVLVERIIQRIIHDGLSLDELLVVTFTNASAKEMKERIHLALQKAAIETPSVHLSEQLLKIHAAEITTIHSYCLNLINQYYYAIDLDPVFRTASPEESTLLFMNCLDEVMERHYQEPSEAFLQTVLHLSSDRNDDVIRNVIQKIYDFASANPEPVQWLDAIADEYKGMTTNHQIFDKFFEHMMTAIDGLLERSKILVSELSGDVYSKVTEPIYSFIQRMEMLGGDINHLFSDLKSIELVTPSFPRKGKNEDERHDPVFEDELKVELKSIKDDLAELKNNFYASPDELAEDIRAMAPEVEVLTQLVKDIMALFTAKKREKKILDFTDYEHLALKILINDNQPTPIALMLKDKYREILVDEYQDTNRVQEALLQIINDDHLFMVGDVKQSIYKFRQAEPGLFMEKYQRFQTRDGHLINLSMNFRSRQSVINDTNAVFKMIMDEAVGEIDYNEDQMLYYGAPFDEPAQTTELNLLVSDTLDKDAEIHFVAQKIKDIIENEQVYDIKTNRYRSANYSDIVILSRSTSALAPLYQKQMKYYNIPFFAESKQGFFQTDEINTVMSLLRIIDNPLQDIHLVGVMRSILYQFDEEEIAAIRLTGKQEYFYHNLIHFDGNSRLKQKIDRFLLELNVFRNNARTVGVPELLETIYSELYVIEKFTMLLGGAQRQANLLNMKTLADEFEQSSYRGVFQFIRYVDLMLSRGKDFGEVNIVSDEADVVRMMTVHSSKGLEFPFVIYVGLGKGFNTRDFKQQFLLNQRLGLALNYYDKQDHFSYPTMMNTLFKMEGMRESISEELRLMYVGFTRAKEKLILIGTAKQKTIEKWQNMTLSDKLSKSYRLSANNPLAMIAPSVFSAIDAIDVQIITALEPLESAQIVKEKDIHEDDVEWLEKRAAYTYPYHHVNQLPTKESVSEIKRQTEVDDDATTWTLINQYQLGRVTYERPKFLTEKKRTSAERGTLMHTVMQHFPYVNHPLDETAVEKYIDTLIVKRIINGRDKEAIDIGALVQFSMTPLYQMISNADEVYMELPFVIGKSYLTGERPKDAPMEQLVQGMIDCVFMLEGQYYFVDFKTDQINPTLGRTIDEEAQIVKQRYHIQMNYYKKALEEILGETVKGYLYFFSYREIEV